jgi:aflatoxin B1 aldehyde reductase
MPPQVIFGTATFGMDMTDFQDQDSVHSLLHTLKNLGINRLDTGARYPPLNHGRSEMLIGEAKNINETFVLDTKVFTNTQTDGTGDLKREAIRKSLEGSLHRLQRPSGVMQPLSLMHRS